MRRTKLFLYFVWGIICIRGQAQEQILVSMDDSLNKSIDCVTDTCTMGTMKSIQYQDGCYIGESPEWTGMKVQVKVKNGKIEDIQILKAKGTPEYYEQVVKKLPHAIIKAGTVHIDGISGATLSCNSLKAAVMDALRKAVRS